MNLNIHGRNVEISDWIREYVEKKVGKLERYLPNITDARCELTHSPTRAASDRYTCQLTIWADGQILRAEESTSDIFASVDATVDKVYKQIRRFKGRRYQSKRRASAAASAEAELAAMTAIAEALDEEDDEPTGTLIRRKQFVLQPMDEEEAIEQMELLGHDFFVFLNTDSSVANVVYRRLDGNYGLLDPRIA
jgi:putative sigma-54 modulation protein